MKGESKFVRMSDGIELSSRIKEVGSQVWLIATHGIGEHLERHDYISDLFSHDFNLFQYDLRGHGRSMGEPATIEDFWQYMRDLDEIINYLKDRFKMKRYVLFGHSMGALITCGYLQKYADDHFYPERVFVNAPPVGVPGGLGKIVGLGSLGLFKKLCSIPASIKLGGLVDLKYLSHDPTIEEKYISDELNHLKLHSKLLLELVKTAKEVFSKPIRPACPAYVTYGSEDMVVDVKSIQNYFSHVEKAFVMKEISGAYHEIHNEVEKYRKPYFEYLEKCLMETLYEETN